VRDIVDPSVRTATPADAGVVLVLARELAITFVTERRAFRDSYRQLLAASDTDLLVVDVGGVVRGYLLGFSHHSLIANGQVSWVEEVAVAAEFRRHGLGARLMADFERRARDRGSRFIALATTRAHAFYEAMGYSDHASYFRKLL